MSENMEMENGAAGAQADASEAEADPATINLTFNKGKRVATYTLGQRITLNLGLAYERDSAEAILEHIAALSDDETLGGYEFFYPGELDVMNIPTTGRLVFDAKTEGKGAEKEIKAIIMAYVPPMEEFLKSCSEPARDFFETQIAELLAGMTRKLIDVSESAVKLTGEIPADAFTILAPKPRGVGADKFMPIAVAFTSFMVTQGTGGKLKIPTGDIRRSLASAHFVNTSAYKDLEKPDAKNPTGLFGSALTKLQRLLGQAVADPGKMHNVVETLKQLVKNKATAELISSAFLAEMHQSSWCERMAHERLSAVLKAAKVKKSATEEAGDALLSMLD